MAKKKKEIIKEKPKKVDILAKTKNPKAKDAFNPLEFNSEREKFLKENGKTKFKVTEKSDPRNSRYHLENDKFELTIVSQAYNPEKSLEANMSDRRTAIIQWTQKS